MTAYAHLGRRVLVAATVLTLAALAPSVAASQRSGDLHVSKYCGGTYNGAAGDFCTITASNVNAIKAGSRVYYLQAADFNTLTLDSDIVLDEVGSSQAWGHVTLDFVTGTGTVTFSGGTGALTGFQATVAVSPLGGNSFAWDGSYSFSPGN
jgi:hypothetical protein